MPGMHRNSPMRDRKGMSEKHMAKGITFAFSKNFIQCQQLNPWSNLKRWDFFLRQRQIAESFLLSHAQNKGLLRRICGAASEPPRQKCKADFNVFLSQAVRTFIKEHWTLKPALKLLNLIFGSSTQLNTWSQLAAQQLLWLLCAS